MKRAAILTATGNVMFFLSNHSSESSHDTRCIGTTRTFAFSSKPIASCGANVWYCTSTIAMNQPRPSQFVAADELRSGGVAREVHDPPRPADRTVESVVHRHARGA